MNRRYFIEAMFANLGALALAAPIISEGFRIAWAPAH